MLTQKENERQMEELQQKLSHAEGTSVKCELLCRWCTTIYFMHIEKVCA